MSKFYKSEAGAQPEAPVAPQPAKKRIVLPIHPVLFAVFPLLAYFAHNMGKIPLEQLSQPFTLTLMGMGVGWLFFLLLSQSIPKAVAAAAMGALLYRAYEPIVHLMPKRLNGDVFPACLIALAALLCVLLKVWQTRYDGAAVRKAAVATSVATLIFLSTQQFAALLPKSLETAVLPICLLGLAAVLYLLWKTRQPLYDATAVLNLVAFVLVMPSIWTIATQYGTVKPVETLVLGTGSDIVAGEQSTTINRHLSNAPKDVPDVYYIILDAYGRADRLQTYYGYDNTPFIKALEARGFTIPRHSEANYNQTPLCLASALSMNYLVAPRGRPFTPEILRHMVDDNAVINYLRPLGYHYIDVASGLDESHVNTSDLVLNDDPDLSTLEGAYLDITAFGGIAAHQARRYDRHRKRLNGDFDNVAKAAALPYPKFVFTHILAPHPPFVFGPNGESVTPKSVLDFADASDLLRTMTKDQYRRGYIAQLQYVNKRTLEAVDAILAQSKHRPIILIQGDHGSRMNLDWSSLAKTDLREPFSPLNAYYVPDKVRNDLWDTITPVNSFRLILTDVFGAKDLPRLPDRNYYSTEADPYKFIDVTEALAKIAGTPHSTRYANRTARESSKTSPLLH